MAHVCAEHDVSERRACLALDLDRSSVRYRSRRPDDAAVRQPIRDLASERRRFGYRRLHFLLGKEGMRMNQKRFRRLYREEGLAVRKRGGRKRALGQRAPLALPSRPNERWSLDFVSDSFSDGRRFRMLAVVDDCTRECVALVADTSLSGARVARELDAAIAWRGRPAAIVSDNGTELTSMAILHWSQEMRVAWTTSSPESRSRTRSSRASTGGCVMSCSTRRCSRRSPRRGVCWPPGATTTIACARIRRSPTAHRRSFG